jgi:hypothetical protein
MPPIAYVILAWIGISFVAMAPGTLVAEEQAS